MRHLLTVFVAALLFGACSTMQPHQGAEVDLVDPDATPEARNLFANLQRLAPRYVLFGHQDALAYGVGWEREEGRSDVHDVTGSYPAVYGWDVGHLENGADANLDGVDFEEMKQWIRDGFERGGVITISWHMNNPATGGSSWDTTSAVFSILPGGENHDLYRAWLDRFADFARDLRVGETYIPVIFRPFHEHTGGWFWWGAGHLTPDEYIQLWRFTVEYLRDEKDLHHLLYAYSTDVFRDEAHYLEHYPGDDYVDVLGFDDYHSLNSEERLPELHDRLRTVVRLADSRNKIAALTETGSNGIPQSDWWTSRMLSAFEEDSETRGIAWVLVWRNYNDNHHFAPYEGHSSADDFVRFFESETMLFGSELPEMYVLPSESGDPRP